MPTRRKIQYLGVACDMCGFVHTDARHVAPHLDAPKCYKCSRQMDMDKSLIATTDNSMYNSRNGEWWLRSDMLDRMRRRRELKSDP